MRLTSIFLRVLYLLFFIFLALHIWYYLSIAQSLNNQGLQPTNFNAYVFYATQDTYACSVIVNVFLLMNAFGTKYRIFVFVSQSVSEHYRSSLQVLGATVVEEEPLPLHPDSISYYQDCLLKLAAFRMHEIDSDLQRVLILDSDQLILRNLDHLFDKPPVDFLAPSAYWINDTYLSSTLMLIQPNQKLWDSVKSAMHHIPSHKYDIDLINDLFTGSHVQLPGTYATLSSHWEDLNTPRWQEPRYPSGTIASDWDLHNLYNSAHVIHFTAVGKPWSYDVDTLLQMKPHAHNILVQQWERWRSLAFVLCPNGFIDHV